MRDHLAACACRGLFASLALKDSKLFATRSTCISITRSKPSRTGIHTIGVRAGKLIELSLRLCVLARDSFSGQAAKLAKDLHLTMKIIVLGGCGAMGSEVTRDLARTSDFEEILIADADLRKAQVLAEELGGKRVRAEKIEVSDENALVRRLQ